MRIPHLAIAASVALAALSASCREATTKPDLGVLLTLAPMDAPQYGADSIGRQLIGCDATLYAKNAGSRRIVWLDATFTFTAALDSTAVAAVQTVPAQTIAGSWGGPALGPDSEATARWRITAGAPFRLRIRFFYDHEDGSGFDSTAVSLSCAPALTPGPPPTVTTLGVKPDTAEPGDTLLISYAATSGIGLWQSVIQLSGACDTTLLFPEDLHGADERVTPLVVPAACKLHLPLTVTAAAFDALLQGASRSVTLPGLVDHRPPAVTASAWLPYMPEWTSLPLANFAGLVVSGGRLSLYYRATDNQDVRTVYWGFDPAGYRDSARVSGTVVNGAVAIVPPNSAAGPQQLRVWVADTSGNVSDTVSTAPGAVDVVGAVGPAPTMTTVPLAAQVSDVAYDAKRGVLYLLQSYLYKLVAISLAQPAVVWSLALPDYVQAIDLSPSGDSLVGPLLNSGALGVVDLTQPTPTLATVPLAGLDSGFRLLDVRVAANGLALVVAEHNGSNPSACTATCLYAYSLGSGTGRFRLDAPVFALYDPVGVLGRSADGSTIVLNANPGAFLRYDAAADAFGPERTAQCAAQRPALDATGAHVAIGGTLYDSSLQVVQTMQAAVTGCRQAQLSPDGRTHYMTEGWGASQGVLRSRASDGALLDYVPVGAGILTMQLSPDGTALAVVGELDYYSPPEVGVIDLTHLQPMAAPGVRTRAPAHRPSARAVPAAGRVASPAAPLRGAPLRVRIEPLGR